MNRLTEKARAASPLSRMRACCGLLLLAGCAAGMHPAFAVEDTDTPGDGHWEINIDAEGARTAHGWEIAAPDTEVNYGWGERVQLSADIPWVTVHEDGADAKSGLGAGAFGLKWRFVDQDSAGFSLSVFPQYSWRLLPSSVRRGIVSSGKQLLLPLQASVEIGDWALSADTGRNLVEDAPDEWELGVKAQHPCGRNLTCQAELAQTASSTARQTLGTIGIKWKLTDSLILKAIGGRDFGRSDEDHRNLLLHVGLQILL